MRSTSRGPTDWHSLGGIGDDEELDGVDVAGLLAGVYCITDTEFLVC